MATKLTSFESKSNITLSTRGGVWEYGFKTPGLNDIYDRTLTIPSSSEITILKYGIEQVGEVSNGKLLYIENLDNTNFIRIRLNLSLVGGAFPVIDFRLESGKFLFLPITQFSAGGFDSAFASWATITSIEAQADTEPVDIKIICMY